MFFFAGAKSESDEQLAMVAQNHLQYCNALAWRLWKCNMLGYFNKVLKIVILMKML